MRNPVLDRRGVLASLAAAAVSGPALAQSKGQGFFARHKLPIGLQLYTLGPDAQKDLDGALAAVAKIGYRDIELAGLYGKTPAQMRAALDKAGLKCSSGHFGARKGGADPALGGPTQELIDACHALGIKNVVMPSAFIPDRLEQRPANGEDVGGYLRRTVSQLTADDWKINADLLNEKGAALAKAGLSVGYHNHNFEFAPLPGGTTGLDILLQKTDPKLVHFEMDVGWVAAAGADPLKLMAKYKGRFTQMHVKDIKASTQSNFNLKQDPTEIGTGMLDWKKLLPAAYAEGVRGFFVEQEPPFTRPRIEAVKMDFDYLAGLTA